MQRSKLTQTQDLEPDSDHNFRMSTGPVTPLPQEPQVHKKGTCLDSGPDPPLHGQFGQCRECFLRRFIHFRRRGANRGPVTPVQSCKKVHSPPLFEFEDQLPPPACVSTDLAGGSFSFRCSFSGASPPLRYTERRTLKQTRTQNQNRIIISARVQLPHFRNSR